VKLGSWTPAGRAARKGSHQSHRLLTARTEDGRRRGGGSERGRFPVQQGMDALPAFGGRGAQPAIGAHPLKTFGQDVLKEAPQELFTGQAAGLVAARDAVAIDKGHGALVAGQQTRGAQRGLLDIGRQIVEGGLAAAGGLDIHHPIDEPDFGGDLAKEFGMTGAQMFLEAVAPTGSQHRLRQEEARVLDPLPAQAIGGKPAAGHQVMKVRMVFELTGPGVKHAQQAERRAQMFWIGGHVLESAGAFAEEQWIEDGLVTADGPAELLGDSEGDEEVGDGQ